MSVLVTVGTTKFDELVREVDKDEFHNKLLTNGYTKLEIQYGSGEYIPNQRTSEKISSGEKKNLLISAKSYIDEIIYKNYDLIIGHAGAGTILNSLRNNRKMIVVVNNTLMNNHQSELAVQLHNNGHLIAIHKLNELLSSIDEISSIKLTPFPEVEKTLFKEKLNKLMNRNIWKS